MIKIQYIDGHFIHDKDGKDIEIDPQKVYRISDFAKVLGVDQQYIRNMEKYVHIVFPKDAAGVKYVDQESMKHIALIIHLKEDKNMTYPAIRKEFEDRGYLEHQEQEGRAGSAVNNLSIDEIFETLTKKFEDIPKTLGQEFVEHEKAIVDNAEERFELVLKDTNEHNQQMIVEHVRTALVQVAEGLGGTLTELKDAIETQNEKAAQENQVLRDEMMGMLKEMKEAIETPKRNWFEKMFGLNKTNVNNKTSVNNITDESIPVVEAEIITDSEK